MAAVSNGTDGARNSEAENRQETVDKGQIKDWPAWWTIAALIAFSVVVLMVYSIKVTTETSSYVVFAVELAIGAAALVGGLFFGFLFGIPRTTQASAVIDGAANAPSHIDYRPSNNLEQVSDWLTKILLGAGLVQFEELRAHLAATGQSIENAIGGAATGAVTQVTVVAFSVLGFLSGFLWTRVYYSAIQAGADQGILKLIAAQERTEKKVAAVLDSVGESQLALPPGAKISPAPVAGEAEETIADAPGDELAAKLRNFQTTPVEWHSDPVREIFGAERPAADGLVLRGEVDAVTEKSVVITLRVAAPASRPLAGPVLFLLHPTFHQRLRKVTPRRNVASVTIYPEGWFHVAAIVDRTVLVLDLRNVPGVPDWFRKN